MKLQALILVISLSSARCLIDCRTACRSCRTGNDPPEMLSILCAMCEECKARRRERLAVSQNSVLTNRAPPPAPAPIETQQPAPWRESPKYNITEALRYITEHRKLISEDPAILSVERNFLDQNRALRRNDAPQGCPQPPVCPDDTVLEVLPPCVNPPPPTTTTCPPVTPSCVKKTCSSCCIPMMPCFMPCPPSTTTPRYIDVYVGIPTDTKYRKNLNLRTVENSPLSNVFNTRLRQHRVN